MEFLSAYITNIYIEIRFFRHMLFVKFLVYKEFDTGIDYCKEGNTDDHAHYAPESAKNRNGKNDPEAGQTGVFSQNLGTKNITVKLLQDQNKQG